MVLGGGTGGYVAAIRATQLGLKVALVEKEKVGGVCLHKGCIPTKVLLQGADLLSLLKNSEQLGIGAENIRLDYSSLAHRKDKVVADLHRGLTNLLRKQGVTVLQGHGRFLSPSQIAVEDGSGSAPRLLGTKYAIVATGSRPQELPGLPCDGDRFINSDHALDLARPPQSVVVVGAGAVGVEFASLWLDLGAEVTLLELLPHILPQEDQDLGRGLARMFGQRGAKVLTGARVLPDVRSCNDTVELTVEHGEGRTTVRSEKVLVAVGRQGNVEDLGLENLGVKVSDGFIEVDTYMRTAQPGVYAVGDIAGGLLLAHAAAAEGRTAVEALAGNDVDPIDYTRMPRCVYSRPQVAAVGLTEAEARARGHQVSVGRFPLRHNCMAQIRAEAEGFVKVVADAASGDLLGLHILGPSASELISEGTLARWLDASASELGLSVHPHPTLAEAVGEAALMAAGISVYS
ncbi:MAG: dihydrolipoyl dehydrogenase [Bacillota bacterium]|nr:dihydrolipoyl dehydrogenase [Bacillota bacterium]